MEGLSNISGSDPASVSVFQLPGEPAIVIDGIPDLNPALASGTQLDALDDLDLISETCFGKWMEGRAVNKMFEDKYYFGKVAKFDKETKWYRVVYEDGDFEDLDWHELKEVLLPLDISTPLRKLALRTFKYIESGKDGSSNDSKIKYSRNIRTANQSMELLPSPLSTKSKWKVREKLRCRKSSKSTVKAESDEVMLSNLVDVEIMDGFVHHIPQSEIQGALLRVETVNGMKSEAENAAIPQHVQCHNSSDEYLTEVMGTDTPMELPMQDS